MLTVYYLDHPESGESQVLDGWSYAWGAAVGPVYVFAKGFHLLALAMLVISCAIGAIAFLVMTFAVSILIAPLSNVLAIIAIVVIAVVLQSRAAVELVRFGLIRQGWREGYY